MGRRKGIPFGKTGNLAYLASFYTGKMKLVDSAGRVDKFKTKYKSRYGQASS